VPRRTPQHYSRASAAELPEVSELDVVRHFTRLSTKNYGVDLGTFPLGASTMKYNPRLNEELAALPGFTDIHPDMPTELCQGALELIFRLEQMLTNIAGLDECSLQPAAGAHGEFTALSLIRAFHQTHGSHRKYVLIPDSVTGTPPAAYGLAGYEAIALKSGDNGICSLETVQAATQKYGRDIAALMLTNPNSAGLFEANIVGIAELIHGIGAQVYMDGANMNAILGVALPRDMGIDVLQYHLHKTFSTPHGGGEAGAGPVAVRSHLAPYLPAPRVRWVENRYVLETPEATIGKVRAGFGNFGGFVRAIAYILAHGRDGLRRISGAAVLNANYVRARLSEHYQIGFPTPSFQACTFTDARQLPKGVKALTIAQWLIDKGFPPPTVYSQLLLPGVMLIEPTETESLQELDSLVSAFIEIAKSIEAGEKVDDAPTKTIVARVDEVRVARHPVLTLDDRSEP